MTPFRYQRPATVKAALELLPEATPLAGGTHLSPRRSELDSVVDLQRLPLDGLVVEDGRIRIGATCKLQAMVEASPPLPMALAEAAGLEAPFNLRNMATLAGTLVVCDGRSPLVTVLLAMDAAARLLPGGAVEPVEALLGSRPGALRGRLITAIETPEPSALRYLQIARSPKDRPIVCLALGRIERAAGEVEYRLSLGGYGECPVRVPSAEAALRRGDLPGAAEAAAQAYAQAEDVWASAAYRSHVAGVLTRRLAAEVIR